MRDIVELSDNIVPVIGTSKTVGLVDLRTKVAENDDGWLIGTE
jgi:hypothetical protein